MNHRTRQLSVGATSALLLFLAYACSGENDATETNQGVGGPCTVGAVQGCTCATGQASTQTCTTGTWDACACAPAGGGDTVPCNVDTVLKNRCASCHEEGKFGAPVLKTASQWRAPSKKPGFSIAQFAAQRVVDPTQQMPPAPNPAIPQAEAAILQAWAQQGAPAGQACMAPPVNTGGAPNLGTGGTPAPTAGGGPNTGGGGTFGSGGVPIAGGMPGSGGVPGTGGGGNPGEQVTCYKITARQNASGAKYNVPNTPDYYNCFYWAKPWGNKNVHIVSTKPIIDNDNVIHHWILYAGSEGSDGANARCQGVHLGAAFIAGWAPGGTEEVMPPDIGLQVDGAMFNLETHYNARSAGQQDASGVELCVTEQLRPKTAGVHWLGTQSLDKLEASGTCRPNLTEPVTILSSSPHMHVQGRHMKTIINRANGTKETLHDKPFDFNTQISYETPAVINPGDTLTTTCTYAQPTPFGSGTNAEMCYNFITAYPVGKLVNTGGVFSLARKNDCTQ